MVQDALQTLGDESAGITAQSRGGMASGLVSIVQQGELVTFGNLSPGIVASSDGGEGLGSDVSIAVNSSLQTQGDDAAGIAASSVGVGGAANVTVVQQEELSTFGDRSRGIVAQSDSGIGNSGAVVVTVDDTLVTQGVDAAGITARSFGGLNAGNIIIAQNGDIGTVGDQSVAILTETVSASGTGGGIDVAVAGVTLTEGEDSDGLYARSSGARGTGAISIQQHGVLSTSGERSRGVAVVSDAGSGVVGSIDIQTHSDVQTTGSNADGIYVQTAGNGTGSLPYSLSAGFSIQMTEVNAGPSQGGADLLIDVDGDITTTGMNSDGIHVVHLGGTESSMTTRIDLAKDVAVQGDHSDGIFLENAVFGESLVTVAGGIVQGGHSGAGVEYAGGGTNRFMNYGNVSTLDGYEGMTFLGASGDDQVNNFHIVLGNVDLGAGSNAFNNYRGATFYAGKTVALGDGNLLTNSGNISLGGKGVLQQTDLLGNFLQTPTGVSFVDLNFDGNRADVMAGSGTAQVSGQIALNVMNPTELMPGQHDVVVVSGADGAVNAGASLAVKDSAVVDYRITQPNQESIAVGLNIDFSPKGLDKNQAGIGDGFNDIQLGGGVEEMDPYIVDFFSHPEVDSLAQTYEWLLPEYYDNLTKTTLRVNRSQMEALRNRMNLVRLGGKVPSSVQNAGWLSDGKILLAFNDHNSAIANLFSGDENRKYGIWLSADGQRGDRTEGAGFDGYDYDANGVSFGLDGMIGPKFFAGISGRYGKTDLDVNRDMGSGEIESKAVSLYVSYAGEKFYLDTTLIYGQQFYDNERRTEVLGVQRWAESNHDADFWSGSIETGRVWRLDNWRLQPYLSFNYAYLDEEAFDETGADELSLKMKARSTESLASDLGGRIARAYDFSAGSVIPEVTASWNYDFGIDDEMIRASFVGAPGTTFSIEGREPERNGFVLGAAINFVGKSGFSSYLRYREEIRSDDRSRTVMGEFQLEF